jgi:hypothetical protein
VLAVHTCAGVTGAVLLVTPADDVKQLRNPASCVVKSKSVHIWKNTETLYRPPTQLRKPPDLPPPPPLLLLLLLLTGPTARLQEARQCALPAPLVSAAG